jgi:DNA-binding MarR family transcriptional regulator
MKYKYYFRKPRSEIAKDIIQGLAISGLVCLAATSPYFGINLIRGVKKWRKYKGKKLSSIFSRLRRNGYLDIREERRQIYISLTDEGKRMAGWLQIDALEIKRPKQWDRKWRIVIFDIAQVKKLYREAFRGKLKELGFVPLQKSVWLCPFECRDEVEVLREFFGLDERELRLIVGESIGNDRSLRKIFRI